MKELETKTKEKTHLSQQKQVQQEYQVEHVKSIFPHRGHSLWEINTITGAVKKAEYNFKSDYHFDPDWKPGDPLKVDLALVMTPDCVYVAALNKESALKKWKSGKDGSKFKQKGQIKFY